MLAKPEKVILLTVSRAGKQADSDIGKHINSHLRLDQSQVGVQRKLSQSCSCQAVHSPLIPMYRLLTDPQSKWFKYLDFS